jgi:hypothetical protein
MTPDQIRALYAAAYVGTYDDKLLLSEIAWPDTGSR